MDDLPDLNEASILENTRRRFHMDQIYTRTGPILIAMNPFKWLQIYGDDMIQRYHRCEQIDAISPHCLSCDSNTGGGAANYEISPAVS